MEGKIPKATKLVPKVKAICPEIVVEGGPELLDGHFERGANMKRKLR